MKVFLIGAILFSSTTILASESPCVLLKDTQEVHGFFEKEPNTDGFPADYYSGTIDNLEFTVLKAHNGGAPSISVRDKEREVFAEGKSVLNYSRFNYGPNSYQVRYLVHCME